MKKILYAAAECDPFVKTGGLGTVVGSVPKVLCDRGYDVRVILPLYECIDQSWKDQMEKMMDYPVCINDNVQSAKLYKMNYNGVIHYFIGNDYFMTGDNPYSDFWQDVEKFSFFARAVLELPAYMEFEPDIIHCHDWHSSLIPVYLKTFYMDNPYYRPIRTVMTIHNLKFQGQTDIGHFKDVTGLPDKLLAADGLLDGNCGNMLKGGILFADKITTVSSTYAKEIMQPEFGERLDEYLRRRRRDVSGIVNGIDTSVYDPASDENLFVTYDINDFKTGKRKNKAGLQKLTGLPQDESVFAAGIISRLTDQKGFELLEGILDGMMELNIQLYILGNGQEDIMQMFYKAKERHPDGIYLNFHYKDALAKKMYAACDAVLMPSRFEPCGLSQMMSYRYGTVPIVRLTGGLVDTVKPYHEKKSISTGFGFRDYNPQALADVITEAVTVYYDKPRAWTSMVRRCMEEDYSWESRAGDYIKLYNSLD